MVKGYGSMVLRAISVSGGALKLMALVFTSTLTEIDMKVNGNQASSMVRVVTYFQTVTLMLVSLSKVSHMEKAHTHGNLVPNIQVTLWLARNRVSDNGNLTMARCVDPISKMI